jgi:hypothetical protein
MFEMCSTNEPLHSEHAMACQKMLATTGACSQTARPERPNTDGQTWAIDTWKRAHAVTQPHTSTHTHTNTHTPTHTHQHTHTNTHTPTHTHQHTHANTHTPTHTEAIHHIACRPEIELTAAREHVCVHRDSTVTRMMPSSYVKTTSRSA